MIIGTSNFYYLIDKKDYFKLQTYQWKDDHGCAFTFIDGKRTTMIELIMESNCNTFIIFYSSMEKFDENSIK